MSKLALSASFEYLCYASTAIRIILILSVRLYTLESDVGRRQILKYKDGPRTERVKLCLATTIHNFKWVNITFSC